MSVTHHRQNPLEFNDKNAQFHELAEHDCHHMTLRAVPKAGHYMLTASHRSVT
jgi:hypothetical protein